MAETKHQHQQLKTTHSFSNHSSPAFIESPFHDGVVRPGRTRRDNERVGHVQPIDSDAEIGLPAGLGGDAEPDPSGPNRDRAAPSPDELGDRVVAPSDMGQAQRSHGSNKNGEFSAAQGDGERTILVMGTEQMNLTFNGFRTSRTDNVE